MSNNPPPYGPPPGGGDPYGQPPASGQPYGQPGAFPGGPQPAFATPYGAPPGNPSKKWYQRWWVWLVAVIALIIIAFFVFAALRGNKYALESKLKDFVQAQNHTISDVKCPDSIDTDKGHEYDCTAILDGKEATLHVNFISDQTFTVTQTQ